MAGNLLYDRDKLETFFKILPRTTTAAAALAHKHDHRVSRRAWLQTDRKRPIRHALEVRHGSFETAEFVDLLRKHNIALVVADTAGKWPFMEDAASDFVYVRLHGDEELYVSGYTPPALDAWAKKIRSWVKGSTPANAALFGKRPPPRKAGRDVFVYFDNDVKVRAPFDAMSLAHRLGLGPLPSEGPAPGTVAELPRRGWPGVGQRRG